MGMCYHLISKYETSFNIASINTCTEAEGPGKRLAIWFQGCDIYCKECCNPDFIPIVPKHIIELSRLIDIIIQSKKVNDIEGVTYLGGEPTLQIGLPLLSKNITELGLGVIMFTGKIFEEIDPILLTDIDMIIDGPYVEQLRDEKRNLIGSSNQSIICLTTRYVERLSWFNHLRPKQLEVNIEEHRMIFTGDVI